jgi:hypothetical protein
LSAHGAVASCDQVTAQVTAAPLSLSRLASYAPVINKAASRVAEILAPSADQDVPVDIYQLLQAMTIMVTSMMDVIGRCAFG